MSRHKLVKGLDLDEELDDYDGGDADYDEDSTPPSQRHELPSPSLICRLYFD